jgi:hypothetical protein
MPKTLSLTDVVVTPESGDVVSPFDCSTGPADDNDCCDIGHRDKVDDWDSC